MQPHTSIEEWTEKLLEEARDDLELVDSSAQTDFIGDTRDTRDHTRDQSTQTDIQLLSYTEGEEQQCKVERSVSVMSEITSLIFQFDLTVTGLACHAVKQSLYEILQEEVENI